MSPPPKNKSFEITWPLFGDKAPFPADPAQTMRPFALGDAELRAFAELEDLPESSEQAEREARRYRETLPPLAPEWMRAARALADWLEQRIAEGKAAPVEQAAIARTWAAFSLGGITQPQVVRVAHVVDRAYQAIRVGPRDAAGMQAAITACAGVLHQTLPSAVRARMPLERAVYVVRKLMSEADAWAAIVEGTSELLGWKDYARVHAASVIRALIEQERGSGK
jgi:hypothetical protein